MHNLAHLLDWHIKRGHIELNLQQLREDDFADLDVEEAILVVEASRLGEVRRGLVFMLGDSVLKAYTIVDSAEQINFQDLRELRIEGSF